MTSPVTVSAQDCDESDLIDWLPYPHGVLAWLRGDEGFVGWGTAATFRPVGRERFGDAQRWWNSFLQSTVTDDAISGAPDGPIGFVRMAYADESDQSLLTVPKMMLVRRDGAQWTTRVMPDSQVQARAVRTRPVSAPTDVRYRAGRVSSSEHRKAVAAAVARIDDGRLDKVVLARDVVAYSPRLLDQRWIIRRLSTLFPTCWVFAVDGLLGASPELLLRVTKDRFEVLVLAGTAWPDNGDDPVDLLGSHKDRSEHEIAVDSVMTALGPLSATIYAPSTPSVLRLPNVDHLATQVRGRLASPHPAPLVLLGRLHPTAAVCGTPRQAAQDTIRELEKIDRGGYLGPVGWLDANGNAEFAIALRCAQLGSRTARLFAGGGIVAGSTPDREDAEVEVKLNAFRSALGDQDHGA